MSSVSTGKRSDVADGLRYRFEARRLDAIDAFDSLRFGRRPRIIAR